jgi:hypothetical protein
MNFTTTSATKVESLELGIWNFFGAWGLVFGTSDEVGRLELSAVIALSTNHHE